MGQLVDFVRISHAFSDFLRSIGVRNEIVVRLTHEDGNALLRLLTGSTDVATEPTGFAESQLSTSHRQLKICGLCFEWPLISTSSSAERLTAEIIKATMDEIKKNDPENK